MKLWFIIQGNIFQKMKLKSSNARELLGKRKLSIKVNEQSKVLYRPKGIDYELSLHFDRRVWRERRELFPQPVGQVARTLKPVRQDETRSFI